MFGIYAEVARRIAADVPQLKWLDLDKGQLEDPEAFNSIIVPAVLIAIPEIEWTNHGRREQRGSGNLVIKTVIRLPEQTHHSAPLLLENLKAMTIADDVNDAVLAIPGITVRLKSTAYPVASFYVIEQHYAGAFKSEATPLKEVTVPLQINPSIHKPAIA